MRLTKKSDKLGYCLRHSSIKTWQCWDKLGYLEDLEEELGIDLVLIGKLLKQGFYFKNDNGNILHLSKEELKEGLSEGLKDAHNYFKDYGKTWALTKEELEK